MDVGGLVFEIRNAADEVELCLDEANVPKRLPPAFQLSRQTKKGKLMVLLYRTKACEQKLSEWLEDWKQFPTDQRRWLKTGQSIIKQRRNPSVSDEDMFGALFGALRKLATVRADHFHYQLDADAKARFAKLPTQTQISLLCISTRKQSQLQKPGFDLCAYAEHIATRHERHRLEKEAALQKEHASNAAAQRLLFADRCNLAEDDGHFVNVGSARWTHEISPVERSPLETLMHMTMSMYDQSGIESAEDRLSAPVAIPIVERLPQSKQKGTDSFLQRLSKSKKLNHNVRQRCWFFYVLQYIREEAAKGVFYTTESILSGGEWIVCRNDRELVVARPLEQIPLDEEVVMRETLAIVEVFDDHYNRRRRRRGYF